MVERFVYVIAFLGDAFLMVRHRNRKWEMPGGRLLRGEAFEDGARREFLEETGHALKDLIGEIEIKKTGGRVFVGLVGDRVNCELSDEIVKVKRFRRLPTELSFPLVEYRIMLAQARTMVETFKNKKSIGRTASPLNSNAE